jgi:hypothetical protein
MRREGISLAWGWGFYASDISRFISEISEWVKEKMESNPSKWMLNLSTDGLDLTRYKWQVFGLVTGGW